MLALLLSLLIATPVHAETLTSPVHVEAAHTPPIEVAVSLREKVELAFPDDPLMWKIIKCESKFRQFDSKGNPLRSRTNDYGIAQIHATWIPVAKKMGLDIVHSADDNLLFAKHILKVQGHKAWTCSAMS